MQTETQPASPRRSLMSRVLARFILYPVIGYALLAAYGCLKTDQLIFPRPPCSYTDDTRILKIRADDGVLLSAVWLPHPGSRYTLLFTHGNYEDLGGIAPVLGWLRNAGFSVFSYDYRGYGTSGGGTPKPDEVYADQRAMFRYVVGQLGVAPSNIIAHGRSVGAAAAIELAASTNLAGLIVESGFVSAFRVQTGIPLLPFDKFRNLARMPAVKCPVLVIHGQDDDIIPPWHGRKLYGAVRAARTNYWVAGAGHNDLIDVAGEEYLRVIRTFADGL